jgi:hypothetical protein
MPASAALHRFTRPNSSTNSGAKSPLVMMLVYPASAATQEGRAWNTWTTTSGNDRHGGLEQRTQVRTHNCGRVKRFRGHCVNGWNDALEPILLTLYTHKHRHQYYQHTNMAARRRKRTDLSDESSGFAHRRVIVVNALKNVLSWRSHRHRLNGELLTTGDWDRKHDLCQERKGRVSR